MRKKYGSRWPTIGLAMALYTRGCTCVGPGPKSNRFGGFRVEDEDVGLAIGTVAVLMKCLQRGHLHPRRLSRKDTTMIAARTSETRGVLTLRRSSRIRASGELWISAQFA